MAPGGLSAERPTPTNSFSSRNQPSPFAVPLFRPSLFKGEKMNGRLVLKYAAVFAVSALALAGSASAQWSGRVTVSDAVETSPSGRNVGGVSVARCENNVVV